MKCHKCGYEFKEYSNRCPNCNSYFLRSDYLNRIIEDFIEKYSKVTIEPLEFPSNKSSISFKNILTNNINEDFYIKYKDNSITPEEFAIEYYKHNGYQAFFAENYYWVMLFFMIYLYQDFNNLYLPLYLPEERAFINAIHETDTDNIDFNTIYEISNLTNHIIDVYFNNLVNFYKTPERDRRIYRSVDDLFSIDELLMSIFHLNKEQLKLIFERMGEDFEYYTSGLPDLIVYNEKEFFFVEVKSKTDTPSFKQVQWHKFLTGTVGIDVVVFMIDKSEEQIINIEKKFEQLSKKVRKENIPVKPNAHSDKILLYPKEYSFYYFGEGELYIFLKYTINHSSGKGKPKGYLECFTINPDKKTLYGDLENENTLFFNLMESSQDWDSDVSINYEKMTHLEPEHLGGLKEFKDYRKKIKTLKEDLLFQNAKKMYFPNVFADFRPTKKQLERNKKAKLLEEMNDFEGAIKLYEKNVSEKTGSSTTYKRLYEIYQSFDDLFRIIEISDIAIPIFIYLNDKKNTLYFLNMKAQSLYALQHEMFRETGYITQYYKFVTKEENDYLYENCCVDDVDKILHEKIEELKSNARGGYYCSNLDE